MDQVPTADLLNLLFVQRGSIDLQFQFWLSITFAVLAAGFVAGPRLRRGLRLLAAFLYAMASAHLMMRWMYDGAVGRIARAARPTVPGVAARRVDRLIGKSRWNCKVASSERCRLRWRRAI